MFHLLHVHLADPSEGLLLINIIESPVVREGVRAIIKHLEKANVETGHVGCM